MQKCLLIRFRLCDCLPFACAAQTPPEASRSEMGRQLTARAEAASSDSVAFSTRLPLEDLSLGAKGRVLKQAMPISGKIGGFAGGGSDMSVGSSITYPNGQNTVMVASLTLTVADPRQPTAALTLEMPAWVRRGALLSADNKKGEVQVYMGHRSLTSCVDLRLVTLPCRPSQVHQFQSKSRQCPTLEQVSLKPIYPFPGLPHSHLVLW